VLAAIHFRIFCLFCLLHENGKIKLYKTIILFVVLCEFETWPLTIMEEHRLRVRIIGFLDFVHCQVF
jgi:hypothetical protein